MRINSNSNNRVSTILGRCCLKRDQHNLRLNNKVTTTSTHFEAVSVMKRTLFPLLENSRASILRHSSTTTLISSLIFLDLINMSINSKKSSNSKKERLLSKKRCLFCLRLLLRLFKLRKSDNNNHNNNNKKRNQKSPNNSNKRNQSKDRSALQEFLQATRFRNPNSPNSNHNHNNSNQPPPLLRPFQLLLILLFTITDGTMFELRFLQNTC